MQQPITTKSFITVYKPMAEVYTFWRDLRNLPLFLDHVESVTAISDKTYELTATLPAADESVTWRVGVIADEMNGHIEWRSLPDSPVESVVIIQLKDAGKFGTEVYVSLLYKAQANTPSAAVKAFLASFTSEEWLKENLKDFRRVIETGEIPTIEGQASGNNKN